MTCLKVQRNENFYSIECAMLSVMKFWHRGTCLKGHRSLPSIARRDSRFFCAKWPSQMVSTPPHEDFREKVRTETFVWLLDSRWVKNLFLSHHSSNQTKRKRERSEDFPYRCSVGLFGGRVEVLPNGTGVRGVTGKAGVSGRETSVSVSERYDETDSLRVWAKENKFSIRIRVNIHVHVSN